MQPCLVCPACKSHFAPTKHVKAELSAACNGQAIPAYLDNGSRDSHALLKEVVHELRQICLLARPCFSHLLLPDLLDRLFCLPLADALVPNLASTANMM